MRMLDSHLHSDGLESQQRLLIFSIEQGMLALYCHQMFFVMTKEFILSLICL